MAVRKNKEKILMSPATIGLQFYKHTFNKAEHKIQNHSKEETKLIVPAGKGVQADALEEYDSSDDPKDSQPCSSIQGQQKEVSRRN